MKLIPWPRSLAIQGLAKGLHSRDQSRPRRAVEKHLQTAAAFGLISEEAGEVALTYRGRCLRDGGQSAAVAVRAAFATEDLPRRVTDALLRDTPLTRAKAETRLAVYDQAHALDVWLEWLSIAKLILWKGEEWVASTDGLEFCIDAFDQSSFAQLERELYLRLVRDNPESGNPSGELHQEVVRRLRREFEWSTGPDAEEAMLRLLDRILRTLGFEVQYKNGPRERAPGTPGAPSGNSLSFGPEGDDLIAVFLRTPLTYAEACEGWAWAIEAKAGAAPKKAVTQALAFRGRVVSAWGERVRAYPIVVSSAASYADGRAKGCARDNGVVHVPLEALCGLAERQWKRLQSGQRLITPPALLSFTDYLQRTSYIEPVPEEFSRTVEEITERDSAAWLPDSGTSED